MGETKKALQISKIKPDLSEERTLSTPDAKTMEAMGYEILKTERRVNDDPLVLLKNYVDYLKFKSGRKDGTSSIGKTGAPAPSSGGKEGILLERRSLLERSQAIKKDEKTGETIFGNEGVFMPRPTWAKYGSAKGETFSFGVASDENAKKNQL